jgi:pilus assembly protein Flp/PilA
VSDGQRRSGELQQGDATMLEQLKKLMKDEEAPTAVEYALMVAGIAVVVMGTVFILGRSINTKFSDVNTQINTK